MALSWWQAGLSLSKDPARARIPGVDQEEYFFNCPYCWQQISMLLDTSVSGQRLIEDCEVCCNPIEVTYSIDEGQVTGFNAEKAQP
ncbi:MAG TPA: CPXCG motif-containing cysteine-rich protein [Bdellovibrionales bacterium]|nr:CPXCG motif-containing cysteine-rich protein [Bdellovibrionales bacterium]